jgi:DNA-binding NtrC family response regulator
MKKKNILIVDDEADIRRLIRGILEDEGYEVIEAENSKESLSLFESKKPDLAILDIWLQGSEKDGLEILKSFKETAPHFPVLMISGHGNIETAVHAIKNGAYDFIEKPFKSDRLLLMIARAIEKSILQKENDELKNQGNLIERFLTTIMPVLSMPQNQNTDMYDLSLREAREMFEREYLMTQIKKFDGNISKTAEFIGMERSALHRKLKSLDISPDDAQNGSTTLNRQTG